MLVNLLATPGLGTIVGGRLVAGTLQLAIAVGGAGMILVWLIRMIYRVFAGTRLLVAFAVSPWLWIIGLGALAAAWIWSLVSSLAMLREAQSGSNAEGGGV
jgi:hypothetical protein